MSYAFGAFQIDTDRRLLLHEGRPLSISPKAFDVLVFLIENRGRVVDRREITAACWPDTLAQKGNLTNYICTLRQLLGEERDEHGLIVTVPGRGYSFVASVSEIPQQDQPSGRAQTVAHEPVLRSIAVLPFQVVGAAIRDEYLSVGLANALITRLSRLRQIVVRQGSPRKRGVAGNLRVEGRQLRVDALLFGSVERWGENLRVTVQLVRVWDGAVLWAEQFQENLTDLFRVEDSIAERTIGALTVALSAQEDRQLAKRPPASREAYHAYLHGQHLLNKRTAESHKTAIEYFERAIAYDPRYALAYTGLADAASEGRILIEHVRSIC